MPLPLWLPGAGSHAVAPAAQRRVQQPVVSSGGGSSSTGHCHSHGRALQHPHTIAAAAAAAAFPLPDGNSHQQLVYDARRHHGGASSSSSSRSAEDCSQQAAQSSNSSSSSSTHAVATASAAAMLLPPPPPAAATHYGGWQISSSSSIRHSVEEALRGVNMGDELSVAFVPAHASESSSVWQQQVQQQVQHEESSELEGAVAEAADAAAAPASDSSSSGASAHALTKLIQGCRSAAALEALLQRHEDQQLDHVHACAALVQLARLHRQQQPRHDVPLPLLRRLEVVVLQQLPRLQSRHTSNVLWACACLGHAPGAPLLRGLLAHAQPLLAHGTTPQGFANTLWAAASLRAAPSDAWMAQFFAASQRHLPNFQPQELSSTIWALAQLQRSPPPAWHAAFMAAAAAKLGSASSQALSNTLWGLAKLRLWVAEDVWAALTYACSLRAAEFSAGGLSQLCWAAGMLVGKQQRRSQRHQDLGSAGQWQQQQSSPARAAAGRSAFEQTDWLQPLLVAAEQQLPQYSASTLASLLWSLAVMQHAPGQQFVAGCLTRLASTAQELSPASTATAVWAMSKLDASGSSVCWEQLAPLLQQLQVQLPRCSPQHCVYVAAAFVHLKQQHAGHQGACSALQELEQQLLAACRQQLPSFGLGQLCQLAKWLVAANVSPDAAWVHAFLAAVAQQLPALQPAQQLLLLQAVAHWRVAPHQGWSALFLAAVAGPHAVGGYSAAHVGALLQAFAAAGLQPGALQLHALLQHMLSAAAAAEGCCPAATAAVLGGLCCLGFRPPIGWAHQLWAASARGLVGADGAGLACLAQALQHPGIRQLELKPNKPFAAAFTSALVAALPQLQPQQAAAALAALAGLHLQPPQQEQHAQLLSCLMAAAAKGLYTMPLQEVVAAWWGLVELRVLGAPVPLQQLASPPSQQQQQDQQWLQQQWQGVWLRRIFSSSSSSGAAAADLSGLGLTPLLQLADCLGRLQQPAPAAWGAAYVAAVAAHLPALAPHQLQLLVAALPALGGAAAFPGLAARLLALLQPVLSELTPGQLSSVLAATHEAGLQPPEAWLQDCVSAMNAQLPAFTPRHLIRALASLARLRYVPQPAFLAAATEAAVDGLARHRLLPAAFVELLWALTALRVRPSAAWMAKFEARLLERRPERLDGSQLSRLGWCMAALQRRPGQVLMGRWLAATEAAMLSMDGGSLADTLWCCAMLDEQPSRSWLQAFIAASKQQLDGLSSSSLVTLLWALALLQQRPPSDWMHRCLGALAACLDATCTAAAAAAAGDAADDTQQAAHQQQVAPLSPQQLTRVTWALAALDCQLPAHVSAPLLQLSLAVVDRADVDSLAQLVRAWDRLDETASKQHVRQLAAAARARLMHEGEQHAYSSSSSSSSGGSNAVAGLLHAGARTLGVTSNTTRQHVPLRRPPAGAQQTAVRLVRGKVVVRPASGRSPAAQQLPVVAPARMQELAAAAAAHGVVRSGDFAAALRQARAGGGRQALLAGLRLAAQQQAPGEDC